MKVLQLRGCYGFLLFLISVFSYIGNSNANDTVNKANTLISWKDLRDKWVVKQNYDYSCGASSLATIFTYYYNKPLTEKDILEKMGMSASLSSFYSLGKVVEQYDYQYKSIILDFTQLRKLTVPTLVHINYKRDNHFSVLRFIDNDFVYLADSSWGNRKLTHEQFRAIWEVDQDYENKGRIMLILPKTADGFNNINKHFLQKYK